jgi:hypothetical protein
MYRVSSIPRPPLASFLLHCMWYGASRGALYGLIWGTAYGAIFLLIGAVIGAPVGLVFGFVVGALDGLICGGILYRSRTIFTAELDQATISARSGAFKTWMGLFTCLACLVGGYLVLSGGRVIGLRSFFNGGALYMVLIPSLIAGLCGYAAIGRLLRWYVQRWVFGLPEKLPRTYSGERLS